MTPASHCPSTFPADFLLKLLAIPSPSGYTDQATQFIEAQMQALGLETRRTRKGALTWTLPGAPDGPHLVLSAHTDTLGAMVKEVLPSGRLRLTQVGSYDWTSIEGEYVTVHTQHANLSGTVLNSRQSTHVWGQQLRDLKRDASTMEVRLDVHSASSAQTRKHGVEVGDFVSFEARPVLTPAGYLKSRHLDNKAAVAVLLELSKALLRSPGRGPVSCLITTYEEVGHGAAAGLGPLGYGEADELIAIDMAAVGEGQNSSEHHVTLCVKDSSGPYDFALGNRLRAAAQQAGLELKIDIYPYYSSDASAAWAAGHDLPAALIGPGVDASHAYERTHLDALSATLQLLLTYCQR